MLSVVIMIILLVGAASIASIYSSFLTFYENFSESQNYNKAYYASIAALERAELVIKQRDPGYQGSAGWINGVSSGSSISGGSGVVDGRITTGFSYLSVTGSSLFWDIKSLTNRIPASGQGNVDLLIAANDSKDYNMMDYDNSEVFLLYKDKSLGNPYTGGFTEKANVSKVSGKIRLPAKIRSSFGENGLLNVDESLMAGGIKNDAIVDWQIFGKYNINPFTLYATQKVNATHFSVLPGDSAIRESDLNAEEGLNINFAANLDPTANESSTVNPYTIISADEQNLSGKNFTQIFNDNNISNVQLKLSLLNLLYTKNNLIYPFLEYYLGFDDSVPDKYYTITTEGKVGDFQVNLVFKKPTISQSVLGAFTVIF